MQGKGSPSFKAELDAPAASWFSCGVDTVGSGPTPSGSPVWVEFSLTNVHSSLPLEVLGWDVPLGQVMSSNAVQVWREGVGTVAYTGPVAMRVEQPLESDMVVVQPGATHRTTLELSDLFDVTAPGRYTVSVNTTAHHMSRRLQVPEVHSFHAVPLRCTHDASFVVNGKRARFKQPVEKLNLHTLPGSRRLLGTTTYGSCNAAKHQAMADGYESWKHLAAHARDVAALEGQGYASVDEHYRKWMDYSQDATRKQYVQAVLDGIAADAATDATYHMACGDLAPQCEQSTIAYTYPNYPYYMFMCDIFFQLPDQPFNDYSKAGVIQHEASHWVVHGFARDHGYGSAHARSTAYHDPALAVENADNYRTFSELSGEVSVSATECPTLFPSPFSTMTCWGAQCTSTCDPGHFALGSTTRTCQVGPEGLSVWSGSRLVCFPNGHHQCAGVVGLVGDGFCDTGILNTEECVWDGGDCCAELCVGPNCGELPYQCRYPPFTSQPTAVPTWLTGACRVPSPASVGDGMCDGLPYNTAGCAFDGGDCCAATCTGSGCQSTADCQDPQHCFEMCSNRLDGTDLAAKYQRVLDTMDVINSVMKQRYPGWRPLPLPGLSLDA